LCKNTANDHGRELTACFTGVRPARRITMMLTITYDGAKLRSKVKQSLGATKQIEACVVGVFDHIAFRLPPRP